MKLIKLIEQEINNIINEGGIKDILIKRIPFLKEYNIVDHPRDSERLEAQKISYHKNVKMKMGDDLITFTQLNVSSDIIYYSHKIHENIFHNFIIKNQLHAMQPKELDNLTFRVFLMAVKKLEEDLSYRKEIMIKGGDDLSKEVLDIIINEMNGTLFKFEEFTNKHYIDLF